MNTFKITIITLLLCLLSLPSFAVGESGLNLGSGELESYSFTAIQPTANSVENGAFVVGTFTSVLRNDGVAYDGLASITLPIDGSWELSVNSTVYTAGTADSNIILQFAVNGIIIGKYFGPTLITNKLITIDCRTTLYGLSAGDVFSLYFGNNSVGSTVKVYGSDTVGSASACLTLRRVGRK
jgi:hypothetical protein